MSEISIASEISDTKLEDAMRRGRFVSSFAVAAAIVLAVGVPAQASAEAAVTGALESTPSEPSAGFGFMASQGFADYYYRLTETATPEVAAETLRNPSAEVLAIPDLASIDDTARAALLADAVDSALSDSELSIESLNELQGVSGGDMQPRNLGAPILGQPINNNRSWQFKDTYFWSDCRVTPCQISGSAQFTYTIDPGEFYHRVTVQTLEFGNALDFFQLFIKPYANAQEMGTLLAPEWQTNTPHSYTFMTPSSAGKTMIYYIETTVWGPQNGIAESFAFRSNITAPCEEPVPGSYQCRFY